MQFARSDILFSRSFYILAKYFPCALSTQQSSFCSNFATAVSTLSLDLKAGVILKIISTFSLDLKADSALHRNRISNMTYAVAVLLTLFNMRCKFVRVSYVLGNTLNHI